MRLIKQYWLGFLALALLIAAGYFVVKKLNPPRLPASLIQGVGHIDGDVIRLNVKYPGRLLQIDAEEGTAIRKGQVVARLDSREYRDKVRQLQARVEAKEKELAARESELSIARKTIPLALEDARAQLRSAQAEKAALLRQLDSLHSVVEQDERDLNRSRNLYERQLIASEKYEKTELKYRTDLETQRAMQNRLSQADAAIRVARSALEKARAQQEKLHALTASTQALQKAVKAVKAARDEAQAILAQMTLYAPIDGFVLEKIANPGEVLGAGQVVATLIDPRSLYLKIFVDTLQNGRIRIGDSAEIFLDALPDHPIPARVVRIAQKAEFTPKEVSVRSDRIQRVFAVHLKPLAPDSRLKLGLPATGVISLHGQKLPRSLKELPPL